MFRNYIKIAIRNVIRYKIFSLVNVLGLAFGIAISILIYTFVRQELSYDRYNNSWSRIYRVNVKASNDENNYNSALTQFPLAEVMKKDIPEVAQVTRVLLGSHKKVSYDSRHFSAKRFYYADQSFFNVFTAPVIKGNPDELLTDSFTIVITEETARKYFAREDPIGKILSLDNGWKFRVTGVCQNTPVNSHFHYDFLASLKGIDPGIETENWNIRIVSTYILLQEGSKPADITGDLTKITNKYVLPGLKQFYSAGIISKAGKDFYKLYLQPLTDIHLTIDISDQYEAGRQKIYLFIFSLLAGIILFIACVNYMNISTARQSVRAQEIALRKVVGATRRSIIIQFFTESVFFSILATFIALVVIELILYPFNLITSFKLEPEVLRNWLLVPVLLLGALFVGIFSGSYPSLYLSGFRIVNIIKGRDFRGSASTRLRGVLVVSQFALSIVLVVSTLIVYNQLKYLQGKNLGFNQDNIVIIQRAYALKDQKEKFKELLKINPGIVHVSVASNMPGENPERVPFRIKNSEVNKITYLQSMNTDADFIETMQMRLKAGTSFYTHNTSGEYQILVNESAVRELGLKKPVGIRLIPVDEWSKGVEYMITGVLQDYHFESLRKEIKPMCIFLLDPKMHVQNIAVRLNGKDISGSMDYIQKVWKKLTKNEPLDYYFLDKDMDMMYKEEERMAGVFGIFSFLAIFIASLGLFGLAAHTAELRTREIGIRKAMGASVIRIALMLLSNFTHWILYAIIIAFPLSYIVMKAWLGTFAYHINVEAWFFFVAAFLAIIVGIVTVSFQSVRSAKASPVRALQYE